MNDTTKTELSTASLPGIPPEILFLFGRPPLLIGEDRKIYDALLVSVAASLKPYDVVAWLEVRNYVNHIWDRERLRAVKAGILNVARTEGLESVLESIGRGRDGKDSWDVHEAAEKETYKWSIDANSRRKTRERLQQHNLDESDIAAEAFRFRLSEVETLDRMLASVELQCSAALREILRRDEALRDSAGEIIDAEAHEVRLMPSPNERSD